MCMYFGREVVVGSEVDRCYLHHLPQLSLQMDGPFCHGHISSSHVFERRGNWHAHIFPQHTATAQPHCRNFLVTLNCVWLIFPSYCLGSLKRVGAKVVFRQIVALVEMTTSFSCTWIFVVSNKPP